MQDHTMTLWQYDWLQTGRSKATITEYQRQVKRFSEWMGKPIQSACQGDCAAYVTLRREVSETSALLTWKALRSYFIYAGTLDDGVPNPMAKIKAPKVAEPATKGVSPDEVKRLLAICAGTDMEAVRDRAIIHVFACTGLRRSEVAHLNVDDVNIEQRLLFVRTSKSGKPRVVPVSTEATIALLKYLRLRVCCKHSECPTLWLGTRGALSVSGLRLIMVRRSSAAGVKVSAHQFRRSFAVDWLSGGGSQVSLMAICGWSSSAMPARYTRHAAERIAADEYRRMFK